MATKIVTGESPPPNPGHRVPRRTVRRADGTVEKLWVLDFASATIADDLTYVFRKNVERARRENKRITGYASGSPDLP